MILIIDNYDSFVYNISRYVGRLGRDRQVIRNDKITIEEIKKLNPEAIIISPGPCRPQNSGVSTNIIKEFGQTIPILGVCLGHQCIAEAYGGKTIKAPSPVHGRTSDIDHDGSDLFIGLPNPLTAARYHSLIAKIPKQGELKVTASTESKGGRIIMALQHKLYPVYGVQFHPESILTPYGVDLIRNFITLADLWNADHEKRLKGTAQAS